MKTRLGVLVACCLATIVAVSPAVALGQGPPESPSELSGALLLPGSPVAGEQTQAAREATLASPEAVAAREASRTRYKNENPAQAAQTIGEAFPSVIDHQDGPPPLAAGEKSLGFKSANVEQIETGSGYVGVVQSTAPIALPTGGGHWAGVNLALREAGGGFEAQNPLTSVRLPKHLSEGAQLPQVGLSLTPVDEAGTPLSGSEGVTDGSGVLFANTQTDADTLLQPSLFGVDANTVLRSTASPEVLDYKVGLPQGARLVASSDGPGAEVLKEGVVLARIKPPVASDAAGTPVPTSMSVSGDTIVVGVEHGKGSYRYPIMVDPELSGYWQEWSNVVPGNWEFHEWVGYTYEIAGAELRMKHEPGSFQENDYAIWAERTKGYTKIFDVYVKAELYPASSPNWFKSYIELFKAGGGTEGVLEMSGSSPRSEGTVCGAAGCAAAGADSEGNVFAFELTTREAGSTGEQFYVHAGQVSTGIAQEYGKHSTVSYNTSSSEIEGTPNVLAGSGSWMGPYSGKVEYFSEDGGLGVSESSTSVYGSGGWGKVQETNFLSSKSCAGIQCNTSEREVADYKSLTDERTKPLPEPSAYIRVSAKSTMPYSSSSEYGEGYANVKVDTRSPHGIILTGLASKGPEGLELELGEVESHFKVEATDGESVASSGIKTIGVEIDGHEIHSQNGPSGALCSPGPCTGSNEWSINGGELGTGTHHLTVVAEDNAGNVAEKKYSLYVYHASPVAIGPGSVNPESGDFALEASDVSLSDGAGALQVTRHYDSRNLKEGEEGPFGPQWTISLGSQASLEVLPDGSVMVIGPHGLTLFSVKTGGGFEAPEGDKNLTLEYKAPAYVLTDPAQGTTTEFTLPTGAKTWVPTISKGPVAADTVTYEYMSVTHGSTTTVDPTLELAPHASASCAREKMEAGCRALEFVYDNDKGTVAKGEAKNEWGEYSTRLKEVVAVAYNPATKKMATTPVAKYEYDSQGRLRAEWDPRISSALKTLYGYDAEGHVTAVSGPGSQPWLLHYGTVPGDASTGRLLSAIRPSASTALGSGEVPSNTARPTLSSTTPTVGVKISVSSNGTWSGSPLSYSYQWETCAGGCRVIPGAVNQSYYPVSGNVGTQLAVVVSATSATGSVTARTENTLAVQTGTPYSPAPEPPSVGSNSVWSIEYQVPLSGAELPAMTKTEVAKWGQSDDPAEASAAAIFPPDEPMGWPAKSYKRATVYYIDAEARTVNVASPSGGVTTTEYNESDDVIRTLSADNRAAALKEGSKSAEVAKRLDTESKYNGESEEGSPEPGARLLETVGPEHRIKLSSGSEVSARARTRYSYDEGAPLGETFDLVTRTQVGAEYEGKEADVRETRTSYGGQKGLGWTLRMPTSVTTDPTGLDLTKTTVYEEGTSNVVETKAPGGSSEAVYPPVAASVFGSLGAGNGQFNHPSAVAIDSSGDEWVVDKENDRVEKLTESGSFVAAYGSAGTGSGQFSGPSGIAINTTSGNVYVADTGNNRVAEFSASGAFVEAIGWGVSDGKAELEVCKAGCRAGAAGPGNGQLSEPGGVAVDAAGDVFIADTGNDRVQEFSATGEFIRAFGSYGKGEGQLFDPEDVALSGGVVYVTDVANKRIEEFSPTGQFLTVFGVAGSGVGQLEGPWAIATAPVTGDLYVVDAYESRVLQYSAAGKFLAEFGTWGSAKDDLEGPTGIAINASGNIYIADAYNNRVAVWQLPGVGGVQMKFARAFGKAGSGEDEFYWPVADAMDGHGNVWATDSGNDRIQEFSAQGAPIARYGKEGTGSGQFNVPTGIAVNQSTGNVYVSDSGNNRIEELSSTGTFVRAIGSYGAEPGKLNHPDGITLDTEGDVWVADAGNNRVEEFSSTGTFIAAYGSKGTGNGQFKAPEGLVVSGGHLYVADSGNNRIQELSSKGAYITQFGSEGKGSGEFEKPANIAADPAGNLYVTDNGDGRVEEFNATGRFLASFATNGTGEEQLRSPEGITIDSAGDMYVADSGNNRIQEWMPERQAAHDTQTIYYTPKTEATVAACQNHPEWANLPCQTQPAGQPETSGLPNLPVTDFTYNMWDQAETITETFGSTTRTRKNTFDNAGRPLTSEETSAVDKASPKVTDEYNEKTGALEKESTTTEGKTKTITRIINSLGQLTSYTDADGATTTYKYDVDGRTEEVTDSKGYQIYAYDPTTGLLTKLMDSAAKTFTASYDVEGKMLTEGYPNGLTANYTVSPVGQDVKVEYIKTTHCTSSCTWFSDAVVPSIHGETLAQSSTLSSEAYTYDNAGRLLQTQETPAGKGCVTRVYAYDEESNRRSLTTRQPGSKGECTTEGGTVERHVYDPANRLIDSGVNYETLGNTTSLPASDAGGSEPPGNELTSTYYVDGQVASQTQGGETINYNYDPAGRTRETISSGKTASTVITHYDGPGNALSWTSESTEHWTRNIPGIGGEVAAIQTNAGTPVLQLHDLCGNIVATAALSETETKLLSSYNSTEFGVPTTTNPPKYSWLGADGVASELPSGDITQDGSTYIPLTGKPLQTEPIELPIPPRYYNPYERPNGEAGVWGPIALAQRNAESIAAERAAGGGKGAGEAGGGIEVVEGAAGGNAEIASRQGGGGATAGCSAIFQIKPTGEEGLIFGAELLCEQEKPHLEFEACLFESYEGGPWKQAWCANEGQPAFATNARGLRTEELSGGCTDGFLYTGWVWGYIWGHGIQSQAFGGVAPSQTGAYVTCSGQDYDHEL